MDLKVNDVLTLQFDVKIIKVEKDSILVEGVDKNIKGTFKMTTNDTKFIFAHNNLNTFINPDDINSAE